MGFAKTFQLEQDELDSFVDALHMGHLNDPEDFYYDARYDDIPWAENKRMMRDDRTGQFTYLADGIDYYWNDETIVFAPEGGCWQRPMVIKQAANANAIADEDVGYHGLKLSDL